MSKLFVIIINNISKYKGLSMKVAQMELNEDFYRADVLNLRQFCPPGDSWHCLEGVLIVKTIGGGLLTSSG